MPSKREIIIPQIDCFITTDASSLRWGATDGRISAGGRRKASENFHINNLKLKAVYFAIQAYCRYGIYKHIRINCDNTTAIAYINNKGGIKSILCDKLAIDIWNFWSFRKIWISAAHIPGIENPIADKLSRIFNDQTEWILSPKIYKKIV